MPKKTVERVLATGHELLVQLKGNQPALYQRLTTTSPVQPPVDRPHSHELGCHGRIARRTTRVWLLSPGAGTAPWHDHFSALMEVRRHTEVFHPRHQHWRERQETASSLSPVALTAAHAAAIIRAHWDVANRLPYGRDVTLGEDASRIRRNPGLFALLRSFALNLLRFNGIPNISLAPYDNALDFDRRLAYKGL
jgi:hypothetical protein